MNLPIHLIKQAEHHIEQRNFPQAEALCLQILDLNPNDHAVCFMLGMVRLQQGDSTTAIEYLKKAIALECRIARYHYNLGVVIMQTGNIDAAYQSYKQATTLQPDYLLAWFNKAVIRHNQGQYEEAVTLYNTVLNLNPNHTGALNNLGGIYYMRGQYEETLRYYQAVVTLTPQSAGALSNLAAVLKDLNQLDKAISLLKQAVALPSCPADIHSNLLFNLHYDKSQDSTSLYSAHLEWAKRHETPLLAKQQPHKNSREPERRLHIGYVSGDFRSHPVGFFLFGALACHNASLYKIHCYSTTEAPDSATAQLQQFADIWHDIRGMDDAKVAQLIHNDQIDILVDLSGHTAGNRLTVFARKPAPIQVSWLGYFNTTGMKSIDYFITDPLHTPTQAEQWFTEEIIRLPEGYMSYTPASHAPAVSPAPCLKNGYVTFGCFNNTSKINAEVIALWAGILTRTPNARLVLKAKALGDSRMQESYWQAFASHGIARERIDLRGWSYHSDMLQEYQDIDIALDPFPFSGGLTSCDTLWMGVPIITLAGEWIVSRQTASYLAQLGLHELITGNKASYIDLATSLAHNRDRLLTLRQGLRERMAASPLCNARRFAAHVEAAYRDMWRKWCEEDDSML